MKNCIVCLLGGILWGFVAGYAVNVRSQPAESFTVESLAAMYGESRRPVIVTGVVESCLRDDPLCFVYLNDEAGSAKVLCVMDDEQPVGETISVQGVYAGGLFNSEYPAVIKCKRLR